MIATGDLDERAESFRAIRKHPDVVIGAIVTVFYLLYLLHAFTSGYGPRSFIQLERSVVLASHASHVIKVEPGFPYAAPTHGYDGQVYYLIALDPVNARYYTATGTYYYSRVLYPLTARLLALGQAALIPYTLILINLISVVWGTVMLAAWLRRKHAPPWFALIYAGYSGVFVAFQRDLTEPMAYALLATGIYILQFGGKRRVLLSGICFGLAMLTRDKAAILALLFTLGFLLGNQARPDMSWLARIRANLPATIFLIAMTIVPYVGLKVFLYLWMHELTIPTDQQVAPLSAMLSSHVSGPALLSDAVTALIPGLICLAVTVWAFVRGARDLSLVALFVLAVVTTVTLNPVYFVDIAGVMRATTLVVMAALYALPALDAATHDNRTWLYLCAAFWVAMMPALYIMSAPYLWIQLLVLAIALVELAVVFGARREMRALRTRRAVAVPVAPDRAYDSPAALEPRDVASRSDLHS